MPLSEFRSSKTANGPNPCFVTFHLLVAVGAYNSFPGMPEMNGRPHLLGVDGCLAIKEKSLSECERAEFGWQRRLDRSALGLLETGHDIFPVQHEGGTFTAGIPPASR